MTTGLHLPGTDESGSYGVWAREQEKRLGQRTGRQVPWAELSDIRSTANANHDQLNTSTRFVAEGKGICQVSEMPCGFDHRYGERETRRVIL